MMMMHMTFYNGIEVQFPFSWWATSTTGGYVGSLFAVAALAVLLQLLAALMARFSTWNGASTHLVSTSATGGSGSGKQSADHFHVNTSTSDRIGGNPRSTGTRVLLIVAQTLLTTLVTALGYFLMLVSMTYNVGVFLSMMAGFAIGYAAFLRSALAAGAVTGSHCAGL